MECESKSTHARTPLSELSPFSAAMKMINAHWMRWKSCNAVTVESEGVKLTCMRRTLARRLAGLGPGPGVAGVR